MRISRVLHCLGMIGKKAGNHGWEVVVFEFSGSVKEGRAASVDEVFGGHESRELGRGNFQTFTFPEMSHVELQSRQADYPEVMSVANSGTAQLKDLGLGNPL